MTRRGLAAGRYKTIATNGLPVDIFCDSEGNGFDYGNGADGDKTLNGGSHYIEDIFSGYAPSIGQYPHYSSFSLINGAKLLARPYDKATGRGGMIVFKVSKTFSICDTCAVVADHAGWPGGEEVFTMNRPNDPVKSYYPDAPEGTRSRNGFGPGGGRGGVGVLGFSHGAGGGGGSFRTSGGRGDPDNRNGGDLSAIPGPTTAIASDSWGEIVMGSGGGGGGAGHPRESICPARPGSRGGGAIQLAAVTFEGTGSFSANGQQGLPGGSYCEWPSGNPQVGSGGAGSGGLIKIITSSESVGSQLSANGGARPILQGWPGANNPGQRGGGGGAGYTITMTSAAAP